MNVRFGWLILALPILATSCTREEHLSDYVDPMIGTRGPGNSVPGPTRPHAPVKLSPDCITSPLGGYEYDDLSIAGFSHCHLEGSGGGAYGFVLVTPYVGSPGAILTGECFSRYTHEREHAEVGYYAVDLLDYGVRAELTATEHVGLHRYTFPADTSALVLIDLGHSLAYPNADGWIKILGDSAVAGYAQYGSVGFWQVTRVYFYAVFDRPFRHFGTWKGCDLVRPFVPIPSRYLTPPEASEAASGLKAEYFDNPELRGPPMFTRVEPVVNHRWGTGTPDPRLPLNHFSVRWTGKLIPPATGRYRLRVERDDGVRLYLDGRLLLDKWTNARGETPEEVTVELETGRPYDIRLEYFEGIGVALVRLKWDYVEPSGNLMPDQREAAGRRVGAYLDFGRLRQPLTAKVGISFVTLEQAKAYVYRETPGWHFDAVRSETRRIWDSTLSVIRVEGGTREQRVKFYTALYRYFTVPVDYSEEGLYYSAPGGRPGVFPCRGWRFFGDDWAAWDTYRTTHPLRTLIEPETVVDVAQTYLALYRQTGILPSIIGHSGGGAMAGNHAVTILTDFAVKGFRGFDLQLAYQALREDALRHPFPSPQMQREYETLGYVAFARDGGIREKGSVSWTLERCYNDWCVAQMAKLLGREDDHRFFLDRSRKYRNLFDAETGFLRPRYADGRWKEDFDPGSRPGSGNGFQESNAWQETWYVPHDIPGLIDLMGGPEAFVAKLDAYFGSGQHRHVNQPVFLNPFLYACAGAPWKTQEAVRRTMAEWYTTAPDGLPGNSDSASMYAWYVLAALGIYPVTPGDGRFVIASPVFRRAILRLKDPLPGRSFVIVAEGASPRNIYVQEASLNGRPLDRAEILFREIAAGGQLRLKMGPRPSRWGGRANQP